MPSVCGFVPNGQITFACWPRLLPSPKMVVSASRVLSGSIESTLTIWPSPTTAIRSEFRFLFYQSNLLCKGMRITNVVWLVGDVRRLQVRDLLHNLKKEPYECTTWSGHAENPGICWRRDNPKDKGIYLRHCNHQARYIRYKADPLVFIVKPMKHH